jgi:hypothetical protein
VDTFKEDDVLVLSGWPSSQSLAVALIDPYGYTDNQICPKDLPRVLVWQPDPRFVGKLAEVRFFW